MHARFRRKLPSGKPGSLRFSEISPIGGPADPTFKTPQQGAATQVWAATSPQLKGLGGVYCEDCEIAEIAKSKEPSFTGVRDYAIDVDQAARLWALSSELTGINAFSGRI